MREEKRNPEFEVDLSIHLEENNATERELTLIESVLSEIIRDVLNNSETEGS